MFCFRVCNQLVGLASLKLCRIDHIQSPSDNESCLHCPEDFNRIAVDVPFPARVLYFFNNSCQISAGISCWWVFRRVHGLQLGSWLINSVDKEILHCLVILRIATLVEINLEEQARGFSGIKLYSPYDFWFLIAGIGKPWIRGRAADLTSTWNMYFLYSIRLGFTEKQNSFQIEWIIRRSIPSVGGGKRQTQGATYILVRALHSPRSISLGSTQYGTGKGESTSSKAV